MAIQTSRVSSRPKLSKQRLLFLGLGLGGFYFLLPEFGSFHDSFALLRHASWLWVGLALVAFGATYIAAATMYVLLALKPLRYFRTCLIQLATMFANRLLPAGIGAISVSYTYLRHNRHTKAQASAVVATNNLLGFIGHMLLLIAVLITTKITPSVHHPSVSLRFVIYGLLGAIIISGILLGRPTVRRRSKEAISHMLRAIASYRRHPASVVSAVICSMILTSLYVLTLYACSRAFGLDIAVSKIFIVMTFGVIGGTAAPTPGGLGGAEAGLIGGLVLYGASSSVALGVALLYRFLTFWVSLVVGAIVFVGVERRHYIG